MKVLFCTNLPSPYRVDFFNELGKHCDLTVCYERKSSSERDEKWVGTKAQTYAEVYLDLQPVGADKSRGNALREYIANNSFDHLILTNYASPASMEAIVYCKMKKVPYWIEYDGGFDEPDRLDKRILKRFLLKKAVGHLTTCDEHIRYLEGLGIEPERIYKYPFTSITEKDLAKANHMMAKGKEFYRKKLQMPEKQIVVSVGQFIYRKGFDLLINAAKEISDTGVYIIGGEPTEEYLAQAEGYDNIHFVGFLTKDELAEYYCAADLMVLLTREDIWGLVVNEAMAYGLPVITTDHCIAGLELVEDGANGFIVPVDTYQKVAEHIRRIVDSPETMKIMSNRCTTIAKKYTIEKMAHRNIEIIKSY